MTGLKLYQLAVTLLLLSASTKTIKAQQSVAEIGDISEVFGQAKIVREKPYDAKIKFSIQANDEAVTTEGRMAIRFLDDSQVKLTEHSQLTIDEYIFDPDPSKSKMALTFGLGTARFITGTFNRIDKQNIKLKTPTANIAIRGTDFTATVDELGRSLIILLPDSLGLSSGEIEVVTATGRVLLNKPFQATTVSVFESTPSKPVILDLSLNNIDNMLIVTPPKEKTTEEQEDSTKQDKKVSILDFNDLDIDYLAEDYLEPEENLEFTELDIDSLDVNFLEDMLNVLDALALSKNEDVLDQEATGIRITGTDLGQDKETQIITLITGQQVSFRRNVNSSARVDIDGAGSYTVILIQNGVSNLIKVNGGSDSIIKITQSL
tara:strand:- start:364 stop:1494 length:1131 start_codon:yes stop_codon:yes gene_type:complete